MHSYRRVGHATEHFHEPARSEKNLEGRWRAFDDDDLNERDKVNFDRAVFAEYPGGVVRGLMNRYIARL